MQSLITFCNRPEVNNLTTFCEVAKNLDSKTLSDLYAKTCKDAPKRSSTNKSYFVDTHIGLPSTVSHSNRREEHLAIAMFNASSSTKPYKLPDGHTLQIIDYQTPLKARQGDEGIGKIDLFGVLDRIQASVIELKIEGQAGSRADTPLRALLEGLAYCAVVEANLQDISHELRGRDGFELSVTKPALIVMAPVAYWVDYLIHEKAGPWLPEMTRLLKILRELQIDVQLIGIEYEGFSMGDINTPPLLTGKCKLISVQQIADTL